MAFPSEGNCCYRSSKPVRVLLEYQNSTCLTEEFTNCPVYRGGGKVSLGSQNREPDVYQSGRIQRIAMYVVLVVLLAGAGWLAYQYRGSIREYLAQVNPTEKSVKTYVAPTFQTTQARSEEYKPLVLGTPVVIVKTSEPTASSAEANQGPATATPDGVENGRGLLIHYVTGGENLDLLADQYYTTAEAILDINYKMAPPLMEGRTIIVPEGIVQTSKYPQFEAKYIPEKTKVAFIVEKFGCDLALFQRFNRSVIVSQADIEYILAKQWVLIPRERLQEKNP